MSVIHSVSQSFRPFIHQIIRFHSQSRHLLFTWFEIQEWRWRRSVAAAVEAQSVCKNDHFMTLLMIFALRCVFLLHLLFRLITHAQKVCRRSERTKQSVHAFIPFTIINLYANSSFYVCLCCLPGKSWFIQHTHYSSRVASICSLIHCVACGTISNMGYVGNLLY